MEEENSGCGYLADFHSFASIAYDKNHLSEDRRDEFMIFVIQKAAEQNCENQHIRGRCFLLISTKIWTSRSPSAIMNFTDSKRESCIIASIIYETGGKQDDRYNDKLYRRKKGRGI